MPTDAHKRMQSHVVLMVMSVILTKSLWIQVTFDGIVMGFHKPHTMLVDVQEVS